MANTTLIEEATAKINERLNELTQLSIEHIWQFIYKLQQTNLTDYQKALINYIDYEVRNINEYNTERI